MLLLTSLGLALAVAAPVSAAGPAGRDAHLREVVALTSDPRGSGMA